MEIIASGDEWAYQMARSCHAYDYHRDPSWSNDHLGACRWSSKMFQHCQRGIMTNQRWPMINQ